MKTHKKLKLNKDFRKNIEKFVDEYVILPEGWTREEGIIWASGMALTFANCPERAVRIYIE